MKILELSSTVSTFRNIRFKPFLNLVLGNKAEGNESISGHNVGKTSVLRLIEYCLFGKKHEDYFDGWLAKFKNEKINLTIDYQDDVKALSVPISKRLSFTNTINEVLRDNRNVIGYSIRYKSDYNDEFSRINSLRGKDINWKPFVFGLLGYNEKIMRDKMQSDIDYSNTDNVLKAIDSADQKDPDKSEIVNRLVVEAQEIRIAMSKFDFFQYEKQVFSSRLNILDEEYSAAKTRIRKLEVELQTIQKSLGFQLKSSFNIHELKKIYAECGILFADGVVKRFDEVVDFNNKLTLSRKKMLEEMAYSCSKELKGLYPEAKKTSELRAKYLEVLSRKDYKEEYEKLQSRLIEIEKEISVLTVPIFKKSKEEFIKRKNELENIVSNNTVALREELNRENIDFEQLNAYYTMLIQSVLGIRAKIDLQENSNSNIKFWIKIKDEDMDLFTLRGEAFRKLSCGLFDLALAAAFPDRNMIIAHDGIIDGIEQPLKRRYLLCVYRFTKMHNIQYTLSAINEGIVPEIISRCSIIQLSDFPETKTLFGLQY